MAEPAGPPPRGSAFEKAVSMLSELPALPSLVIFSIDNVFWQGLSTADAEPAAFPDVAGILASLRFKSLKVGVAAMTSQCAATLAALFKLSAESFMPTILYQDASGHVQAYKEAKQQTGVPFGEMLYFDDDVTRLRAASSLGMTSQRVRSGLTLEDFRKGLDAFVNRYIEDRGL